MSIAQKNFRVALVSLLVSIIVLSLKTKAYYQTHSVAVLSDALETVINVITALIAMYSVKLSAEPADENHPYGHGKMEYFSAAFEGGLIFFAALAIMFQAIESFFIVSEVTNINEGFKYLGLASVLNLATGVYLVYCGRRQKSQALQASGKHILSDVITTLGIFIGLILVKVTGLNWIDSALGLIIGFWLGYESYKILRENSGALLDETDDHSLEKLAGIIKKYRKPGVIDIHHLRMIRSGNFHHIDAHMVVPEFWDVEKAHVMGHEFEKNVVRDYEYDGEFAFHMDPCQRLYCSTCKVADCKIRKVPFTYERELTKDHMIKGPQYTV